MKKCFIIFLIIFFNLTVILAQNRLVTGIVRNSYSKNPLPGVKVEALDTLHHVIISGLTDAAGNYKIEISDHVWYLMISADGFYNQQVMVNNESGLDISLVPDELSESISTGYSIRKMHEITGSVSHVIKENFNAGFINDPIQLIQGRVSGLSIVKPGGNPNENFDIRLRGLTSINCETHPLIVVDGILDASLDNFDPNDIEAIDVLKDCSATAIYGIRGAGGVILVQTIKRQEGIHIEYNGYLNIEKISRTEPSLTASQWRQFSGIIGMGTDFLNSTDWQDEISRTAYSQVHNLAISGGSNHTSYRSAINYRNVEGVTNHTGFKQVNGRINITQKALNDKLSVDMDFGGSYRESQYGFNDSFLYASIYNPTAPVKVDEATKLPAGLSPDDFEKWDGYFNQALYNYYNPVQILEQNKNDGKDTKLNLAARVSYEIIHGLTMDAFYSMINLDFQGDQYFASTSYWMGYPRNGYAGQISSGSHHQLFESTLRWKNEWENKFNLSIVGGYSYQETMNQGFGAKGGYFITDAYDYNNLSAAQDFNNGLGTVDSYKNSNKIIGFFGSADLNWKELYFVSMVARYDGSSRFGINNKWGFFPGISAGVELTRLIRNEKINSMKFRIGYGIAGNNLPADNMSNYLMEPMGTTFYNGKFIPAYGIINNENKDLKWETKEEFNIGLDYVLFEHKFSGSLEFYSNTINNLLQRFNVQSPPYEGNLLWTNAGKIANTGIEFSMNWKLADVNNFKYWIGLNYSQYLKNEIVSLSDPSQNLNYGSPRDIGDLGMGPGGIPVVRIEEGKPAGQFVGLVNDGISPGGSWTYHDTNHDGYVGYEDRTVIGNGMPNAQIGFANNFKYKNWDLNIFFRSFLGHDLVNEYRYFYERPSLMSSYNIPKTAMDLKNKESGIYLNSYNTFSSFYVEKGNYIKLDNFSLGYNLRVSARKGFSNIRIYLMGNNLFVITGYKGPDPEARYQTNGMVLAPGIDKLSTWPATRSFSLGINLGFK